MATPLERATVLPPAWGARVDGNRKWADDSTYKPHLHIVHFNGGAIAAAVPPYSQESEMRLLRLDEGWHMSPSRPQGPMRAIAYNDAIGQTGTHYMGRGPHNNGGQYGHWNHESRAVLFIVGLGQIPSPDARRKFGRIWLEDPMDGTVLGHRDTGQTECPGDWIEAWIRRQGWITDLGVWAQGDRDPVISSIKVRLYRLGYRPFPSFGPKFTAGTRRQVRRFQDKHGIAADGVAGPQTLRALGGLLGEVFPDDHSEEPTGPKAEAIHLWPPEVERWRPLVAKHFRPEDVDLALGVIRCESWGDPNAVSRKEWEGEPPPGYNPADDSTRASGLFQHVPAWWDSRSHAAGYGGASIFDPEANVATAAWLVYDGWDKPGAPHWHHWPKCWPWAQTQLN